jgi:hypothetical protein
MALTGPKAGMDISDSRQKAVTHCGKLRSMTYPYLQRQARLHVLLACCFVWMVSAAAHADQKADSRSRARASGKFFIWNLQFAAGAADDESLSRGIYLFQVWGDQRFLELQRITLNQCSTHGNDEARFVPRVDSWNTNAPLKLDALKLSDTELEITVYQAFGHGLPAKMILTFDAQDPPFGKLVGIKTSGLSSTDIFLRSLSLSSLFQLRWTA